MQDRIEKSIELKAPLARVWRALTDHEEFGTWFRVQLDGPFVVGGVSTGRVTYPGYEHLEWRVVVEAMEAQRRFAFRWCPYNEPLEQLGEDPPTTLVEFVLESRPDGTLLTVSESGFEALPDDRDRFTAYRLNEQGWSEQIENIARHVAG